MYFKTFFEKFTKKEKRRSVSTVKPGEYIRIEWSRIKSGIGYLQCLNNDPKTKKIFLEVTWNNSKDLNCDPKEQLVLSYSSKELKNFHLINPQIEIPETENDNDITSLQKRIDDAILNEEYEVANELQKKINKLQNK